MGYRFLITGLPRIRSAWLAALFSSDYVECWHDPTHHGSVTNLINKVIKSGAPVAGLCDPAAACIYPREALRVFGSSTVVVVRRSESACLEGLTKWGGREPADWPGMLRNHEWFIERIALSDRMHWVKFTDLDDYEVVSHLYEKCTNGRKLDKRRFELFNTLSIEQHRDKAASAASQYRQ